MIGQNLSKMPENTNALYAHLQKLNEEELPKNNLVASLIIQQRCTAMELLIDSVRAPHIMAPVRELADYIREEGREKITSALSTIELVSGAEKLIARAKKRPASSELTPSPEADVEKSKIKIPISILSIIPPPPIPSHLLDRQQPTSEVEAERKKLLKASVKERFSEAEARMKKLLKASVRKLFSGGKTRLAKRITGILEQNKIKTIGTLTRKTEEEVLEIKGIGPVTINEIKKALHRKCLNLKEAK